MSDRIETTTPLPEGGATIEPATYLYTLVGHYPDGSPFCDRVWATDEVCAVGVHLEAYEPLDRNGVHICAVFMGGLYPHLLVPREAAVTGVTVPPGEGLITEPDDDDGLVNFAGD